MKFFTESSLNMYYQYAKFQMGCRYDHFSGLFV